MTADEARGRVGSIMSHLSDAMYALSLPVADWGVAYIALRRAEVLCGALSHDCMDEKNGEVGHDDR